jgi:hypothetical protein
MNTKNQLHFGKPKISLIYQFFMISPIDKNYWLGIYYLKQILMSNKRWAAVFYNSIPQKNGKYVRQHSIKASWRVENLNGGN